MTHVTDTTTLQRAKMTDGTNGYMAQDQNRPSVVGYGATQDAAMDSLRRARAADDKLNGASAADLSVASVGEPSVARWFVGGKPAEMAGSTI